MAYVLFISLSLIMIGELADRSQLLALMLATRYRAWQVLVGIFLATFVVHFFSTLAGQSLGAVLPGWLLPWVSGLLFIGFGAWTLRGDTVDESEADRAASRFGPVLAVSVAFFFAEIGDKTQVMTMTIAADPGAALLEYVKLTGDAAQEQARGLGSSLHELSASERFWGVTVGSTLGMVIADAIAIGVGRLLGRRLPESLLRTVSGAIFILFGLLTIGSAVFIDGR